MQPLQPPVRKIALLRVLMRVAPFGVTSARNEKAAKWRLVSDFGLAGPTGLEPATSGVTGRTSAPFREKTIRRSRHSFLPLDESAHARMLKASFAVFRAVSIGKRKAFAYQAGIAQLVE